MLVLIVETEHRRLLLAPFFVDFQIPLTFRGEQFINFCRKNRNARG